MSPVELHSAAMAEKQTEINELKAMADALLKSLTETFEIAEIYGDDSFVIFYKDGDATNYHEIINNAADVIEGTPAQCLANVKADAVDEFAMHIGLTGKALSNYVNNLRKTMITTSSKSSLSEVVNKINEEL